MLLVFHRLLHPIVYIQVAGNPVVVVSIGHSLFLMFN